MKFEQPKCINCTALIDRADIDMSTDVAICKECNTIYKFSNLLYSGQDNSHKTKTEVHDGFLYEDFKLTPTLTVELRKLSSFKFHLVMCFFIALIALPLLLIPDLMAKVFGLIFLALSGYLGKEAIYRYLTVYTVELGDDSLRILNNGSLIMKLHADEIAQVYVKRRKGGSSGGNVYYDHDIYLRPKSGEDVKVMKHILHSSVAFEIERIIEEKYGIEDIITKEEYHPKYRPQGKDEMPDQIYSLAQKLKENRQSK